MNGSGLFAEYYFMTFLLLVAEQISYLVHYVCTLLHVRLCSQNRALKRLLGLGTLIIIIYILVIKF